MDKYELQTFLHIHIRGGAWQVVLLFMDELPTRKLPWDWYREVWDEDEKMFSMYVRHIEGVANRVRP